MTLLRFNSALYAADAIRDAVEMFEDFAAITWQPEPENGYFEVSLDAADDVDPQDLAGEFGNAVLVGTIDSQANA